MIIVELDDVLWLSIPVTKYLTYSTWKDEMFILVVGLAMSFSWLIPAVSLAMAV